MFVVSSVNQLEEALRGSAKEILVIGKLVGPVQTVFQLKSSRQAMEHRAEVTNNIFENNGHANVIMDGISVLGRSALLLLIEEFSAVDLYEGPDCTSITIKRNGT